VFTHVDELHCRLIVQRFDDRTRAGRAALARLHELLESLLHRGKPPDAGGDVRHLSDGDRPHGYAVARRVLAEVEQLLDISQAEAEVLGSFDEADERHSFRRILAVARRPTCRAREETAALVVAQRLHVDASVLRNLAYSHCGKTGGKHGGKDATYTKV
jgi:hypothetical protein